MPTEDYDDEIEEVDELDNDVEEIEDVDEIEEVEALDEASMDKGRRQLRRGKLSEFSDKLTGGAARPGQQEVKRSPFVMVMGGAILALLLVAIVFGVMILSASEQRSFDAAMAKLKEKSYPEAEKRFETFLQAYPNGEYVEQARIGLHKSRIQKYTAAESYSVAAVGEGLHEIDEFIRVCRDFDGFADERDDVRRFAQRIARVGAIVAKDQRRQEALDNSVAAARLMEQFAGQDGVPISTADDIRRLQQEAEAAILKQTILTDALAAIKTHLDAGDTFAALESRQALIDRYPVLTSDKDVGKMLDDILKREQELTKVEDVGTEASTAENQVTSRKAASLSLRTQATVDQVSQGRRVFAVGVDSCYGLDSETGEPLWKRNVGVNPPFMPLVVSASKPALLVYQSMTSELVLLDQADGSLMWRQSIPSRPTGEPIVFQQQIYLTTAAGELWKISVDTGKAISRVVFNQPVIGPPAISRDEKFMVVTGDQSVVYTLSVNPLQCAAVSYVEHRLGSVEAPILTTGRIMLLCDNDTADKARLRVLDVNSDTGKITVRYTDYVDGHVRDQCRIRGAELFVPSTPQRITAFSVNDEPDANPPISRIGANQLENASVSPMHLLAGPGGQLWMASQALRKFRLRTNALELSAESAAEGLHLRPIQLMDQNVFVTTNEAYSASVFFTKVDPQSMQGLWRTVIGTNVVAAAASDNNESMILVSDFGEIFRVPLPTIKAGEFVMDRISRYDIPDKLQERVGGMVLKDGRVAAFCGGDEPSFWTFTASGQLEQKWPLLPTAPELQPVALADGVVVAVSGRLHMTANRRGRVEDYRAAQGVGQQASWKSLVALSDTQVLAINSQNEAIRIEYRESPNPHLFEVSKTPLQQAVEVTPSVTGDLLFVATAEGNLLALATTTLEQLGQVALGGVANDAPQTSGNRIFVQVARKEMKVFDSSPTLQQTGAVKLDGRFLVGAPIAVNGGGFVACFSDGQVILLDKDGNDSGKQILLGQAAQKGPFVIGSSLVVIGVDGSLYSVEDILDK